MPVLQKAKRQGRCWPKDTQWARGQGSSCFTLCIGTPNYEENAPSFHSWVTPAKTHRSLQKSPWLHPPPITTDPHILQLLVWALDLHRPGVPRVYGHSNLRFLQHVADREHCAVILTPDLPQTANAGNSRSSWSSEWQLWETWQTPKK